MLRRLVTVHVQVAILLWSALAEGLRVDAIVWLLQPPALFVISFSSLPGCTFCTRFAVVTALAGPGGQASTLDSVTHILIDRSAYLVEPSLLFRAPCCPCCPAASTSSAVVAARESPSRGLVARSCLSCFLRVALAIAVASQRVHQLFTWHSASWHVLHVVSHARHQLSSWTLYSRHGTVNLELLAFSRHQMLLICWHVLLVVDLDFVLSMANEALISSP